MHTLGKYLKNYLQLYYAFIKTDMLLAYLLLSQRFTNVTTRSSTANFWQNGHFTFIDINTVFPEHEPLTGGLTANTLAIACYENGAPCHMSHIINTHVLLLKQIHCSEKPTIAVDAQNVSHLLLNILQCS
jgi:hypothetical protein